ncbi:MAG: thioredoxin domain-containing protein [Terriglobia bacterium]
MLSKVRIYTFYETALRNRGPSLGRGLTQARSAFGVRRLAAALGGPAYWRAEKVPERAGNKLPARKAGASSRTPKRLRRGLTLLSTYAVLIFLVASAGSLAAQRPPAAQSPDQATRVKIEHYLRERFSVGPVATITVGPLTPSIYPGFLKTTVTVDAGKNKSSEDFYVTKDGDYLIQGSVFGLNGNPEQQVERLINTRDQPSLGAASAPVTIVEYADLECPMCAEMHQFLEKQVLPKYGSKVRIIFKEYPLFSIHPWSVQAAVANVCAFRINPADYVPYRSLIFENQSAIKEQTVRQQLLDFGAQAGIDRDKLAACYDAKGTLPVIRQDYIEGQKLGVNSTPTFFINGKMESGALPPADFFKVIDEALARAAVK